MLAAIEGATKAPAYQNRLVAFVKAAVRKAVSQGKVPMSPVLAIEKSNPEAPRQRILADHEIPISR